MYQLKSYKFHQFPISTLNECFSALLPKKTQDSSNQIATRKNILTIYVLCKMLLYRSIAWAHVIHLTTLNTRTLIVTQKRAHNIHNSEQKLQMEIMGSHISWNFHVDECTLTLIQIPNEQNTQEFQVRTQKARQSSGSDGQETKNIF